MGSCISKQIKSEVSHKSGAGKGINETSLNANDDQASIINDCSVPGTDIGNDYGNYEVKSESINKRSFMDSIVSCPAEFVKTGDDDRSNGFKFYNIYKPGKSWRKQPVWIEGDDPDYTLDMDVEETESSKVTNLNEELEYYYFDN
ncbi:hypothetical protein GJ496_011269 [Pomphorhynchus laevis]|nr:hypothetical protein GJ496_011269 [Pomphorhynchus laevis]